MVKLVFPSRKILLDFQPIQNLVSKQLVFVITLKYIVKQANFEHVVRNLRRVVWKTDHWTSSGMLWTFRNQCHFGGTFPYISAVTTFEIHFLTLFRANFSRVAEIKIIISYLLICLFEHAKHQFLCFCACWVHLWGYFCDEISISYSKIKIFVKNGVKLMIFFDRTHTNTNPNAADNHFTLILYSYIKRCKVRNKFNMFQSQYIVPSMCIPIYVIMTAKWRGLQQWWCNRLLCCDHAIDLTFLYLFQVCL